MPQQTPTSPHPTQTALSWALCCTLWCTALPALAQAPQTTLPSAEPAPTATTADSDLPKAPSPAAPAVESCRIVTDKAMAADLKAASAQAQKQDAQLLGRLLDDAIGLWTLASERCTDRAQDRARRNLADSQRSRQALNEQLGAGPECAARQQDANSLQDLAQQAIKNRQWAEAAVLYRKAENMWDVAVERCTGAPQAMAAQRRDQTATDAHNAEFCGPVFERAREASQRLNTLNDPSQKSAKNSQSQIAETLWRDAVAQCKGRPQEIAQSSALRLAKERGTPWVPTSDAPPRAPKTAQSPPVAEKAQGAANTALDAAVAASALQTPAADAGSGFLSGLGSAVSGLLTAAPTAPEPAAATTAPAAPQDVDIRSGDTRFQGKFVRKGNLLSGSGKVTWANGDVYNGELQEGKRHGQGEFVWANGQRYRGTWVQDVPQGKGNMSFASGNTYEGDIAQGEPHGEGLMKFASGDSFQGQFSRGKPQGRGIYRWANGQTYEGPWSQDQPNGVGKLNYANGNQFEGHLANGTPEGAGKLIYASGDEYEGQFRQGAPHGEGTYRWKAGDRYVGQWQSGQKHGQGRFEWANGDRWEGLFQNDRQTEQGTLKRKQP